MIQSLDRITLAAGALIPFATFGAFCIHEYLYSTGMLGMGALVSVFIWGVIAQIYKLTH